MHMPVLDKEAKVVASLLSSIELELRLNFESCLVVQPHPIGDSLTGMG